jgi:uracil-DNA glycosylase
MTAITSGDFCYKSGLVSQPIQLRRHHQQLLACTACPNMIRPVVSGLPVMSQVLRIGQAPGDKEGPAGKPFAWTAGKTMFKWFATIGIDETRFRTRAYMAAVCRCFPGKNPKGGDRVPAPDEIAACQQHLQREIELLAPTLVIPVGKLAINQVLPDVQQLTEIIGSQKRVTFLGHTCDVIALPHPSGASTWHRMSPGKELLIDALQLLAKHHAWQTLLR